MTLLTSRSQHLTIYSPRPLSGSALSFLPSLSLSPKKTTYLVLPSREEIRMPRANGETSNGGDVAGEGELELARGEVPDLDDSVACAGGEPLVPGLDGDGADPAEVTRDDAGELPYWNVEDER